MTPEQLVAHAEDEPIFGTRNAVVRAAIDAAAVALDALDATESTELRARLMLRLAELKLADQDHDAADAALGEVAHLVPGHSAWQALAAARGCRVAIRRGPEPRAEAMQLLVAMTAELPEPDGQRVSQQLLVELVLANAEATIHADEPDGELLATLADLVDEVATDAKFADAVYAARHILVLAAIGTGDLAAARTQIKAIIALVGPVSPHDEAMARLGIVGILVEAATPMTTEEARHHIARARELAKTHALGDVERAALVSLAGVESSLGKTARAIDHLLEVGTLAVGAGDVPGYVAAVAMMAELYAKSGDHVSAYRTIAEANFGLADALGQDTSHLFREPLARLRDRVGPARLAQIAADVARANELADHLAKSSSDPS